MFGLGERGGAGSGGANYFTVADLKSQFGAGESNVSYSPLKKLDVPLNKWVKFQVRYVTDRETMVA